jgi:hypothetical protein
VLLARLTLLARLALVGSARLSAWLVLQIA